MHAVWILHMMCSLNNVGVELHTNCLCRDALFYDMGVNDSFLQMEENLQFEINVSVQELTRTPIFFFGE